MSLTNEQKLEILTQPQDIVQGHKIEVTSLYGDVTDFEEGYYKWNS